VHVASYAGKKLHAPARHQAQRRSAGGEKYRALPPAERVAVMAAMMAVEAETDFA